MIIGIRSKGYASIGADTDLLAAAVALGIGPVPCKAILVGVAGTLALECYARGISGGAVACDTGTVPAGTYVWISATKIKTSGTTATQLTVIW